MYKIEWKIESSNVYKIEWKISHFLRLDYKYKLLFSNSPASLLVYTYGYYIFVLYNGLWDVKLRKILFPSILRKMILCIRNAPSFETDTPVY